MSRSWCISNSGAIDPIWTVNYCWGARTNLHLDSDSQSLLQIVEERLHLGHHALEGLVVTSEIIAYESAMTVSLAEIWSIGCLDFKEAGKAI